MWYQLKLKNDFKEKFNKIESLLPREKLLLIISVISIIYFFWNILISSSLNLILQNTVQSIAKENLEIEVVNKKILELNRQSSENTIPYLQNKKKNLEEKISILQKDFSNITSSWPSSKDMVSSLQKILDQQTDINLTKLESLTMVPLFKDITEKLNTSIRIFKRGFSLELEGSYFGALTFIEGISQFGQGILWDSLWYETIKYPKAKVKLVVYTLTTDEGQAGV